MASNTPGPSRSSRPLLSPMPNSKASTPQKRSPTNGQGLGVSIEDVEFERGHSGMRDGAASPLGTPQSRTDAKPLRTLYSNTRSIFPPGVDSDDESAPSPRPSTPGRKAVGLPRVRHEQSPLPLGAIGRARDRLAPNAVALRGRRGRRVIKAEAREQKLDFERATSRRRNEAQESAAILSDDGARPDRANDFDLLLERARILAEEKSPLEHSQVFRELNDDGNKGEAKMPGSRISVATEGDDGDDDDYASAHSDNDADDRNRKHVRDDDEDLLKAYEFEAALVRAGLRFVLERYDDFVRQSTDHRGEAEQTSEQHRMRSVALQEELNKVKELCASHQKQVKIHQEKAREALTEAKAKRDNESAMKEAIDKAEKERGDAQSAADALKGENEDLAKRIDTLQKLVQGGLATKTQLAQITREKINAEESVNGLKLRNDDLTRRIGILESAAQNNANLGVQLTQANRDRAIAESTASDLRKRIAELDKTIEGGALLTSQLLDAKKSREAAEQSVQSLRGENESLSVKISALEQALRKSEGVERQVAVLRREKGAADENVVSLQSKNDELQQRINDLDKFVKDAYSLTSELDLARKQKAQADDSIAHLQKRNDELSNRAQALESAVDKKATLSAALSEAHERQRSLEKQVNELSTVRADLEEHQKRQGTLERHIEGLRSENAVLRRDGERANGLSQQLEALTSRHNELTQRLEETEASLQQSKAATAIRAPALEARSGGLALAALASASDNGRKSSNGSLESFKPARSPSLSGRSPDPSRDSVYSNAAFSESFASFDSSQDDSPPKRHDNIETAAMYIDGDTRTKEAEVRHHRTVSKVPSIADMDMPGGLPRMNGNAESKTSSIRVADSPERAQPIEDEPGAATPKVAPNVSATPKKVLLQAFNIFRGNETDGGPLTPTRESVAATAAELKSQQVVEPNLSETSESLHPMHTMPDGPGMREDSYDRESIYSDDASSYIEHGGESTYGGEDSDDQDTFGRSSQGEVVFRGSRDEEDTEVEEADDRAEPVLEDDEDTASEGNASATPPVSDLQKDKTAWRGLLAQRARRANTSEDPRDFLHSDDEEMGESTEEETSHRQPAKANGKVLNSIIDRHDKDLDEQGSEDEIDEEDSDDDDETETAADDASFAEAEEDEDDDEEEDEEEDEDDEEEGDDEEEAEEEVEEEYEEEEEEHTDEDEDEGALQPRPTSMLPARQSLGIFDTAPRRNSIAKVPSSKVAAIPTHPLSASPAMRRVPSQMSSNDGASDRSLTGSNSGPWQDPRFPQTPRQSSRRKIFEHASSQSPQSTVSHSSSQGKSQTSSNPKFYGERLDPPARKVGKSSILGNMPASVAKPMMPSMDAISDNLHGSHTRDTMRGTVRGSRKTILRDSPGAVEIQPGRRGAEDSDSFSSRSRTSSGGSSPRVSRTMDRRVPPSTLRKTAAPQPSPVRPSPSPAQTPAPEDGPSNKEPTSSFARRFLRKK